MSSGNRSLEDRVAALEQSIGQLNTFDRTIVDALRQVTEHIKSLASATTTIDREFTMLRSTEVLARASRIYPKTRSVAFIGHGYFGDNVKYAFLALADYARAHDIVCYFVTDDQRQYDMLRGAGFACLPCDPAQWTAQDVALLFGTKLIVIGDNFHVYSMKSPRAFGMLQGAKIVQLWHGIPIKQIGLGYVMRGDNVVPDELIASSGPYEVLVAPGAAMRQEWTHQFAFREFAAIGYPRNDALFRDPTPHDLLNVDRETYDFFRAARREGKPTVFYVPTYRDDAGSDWFASTKIPALAAHCRGRGYAFAINLHPHEHHNLPVYRTRYPDIRFLAPYTDSYPVVRHTDVLITDYSSLMFDFLLLDRPVVFYRADECIVKQRGFVEGRIAMTPGEVVTAADKLAEAVDGAVAAARDPARDNFKAERQKLCRELYDHHDGNSAQRFCAMIEKLLAAE
jgi:CDP-glycerol glycerophosphotransferase